MKSKISNAWTSEDLRRESTKVIKNLSNKIRFEICYVNNMQL